MFQAVPASSISIPDGLVGVDATLRLMRRLILAGRTDPLVRQFTASLVAPIRPQKQYMAMVRLIHAFVRDRVAYVMDIRDVETLHPAEFILRNRYGDCDDKTILVCAMLESIGLKTKLVAVGAVPNTCSHVYAEVRMGQHWIPLECTEDVPVGWSPPGVKCRRTLEI